MAQNTINGWWQDNKDTMDLAATIFKLQFLCGKKILVRPIEVRQKSGQIIMICHAAKGRRCSISGATKLLAVLPQ